MKLTNIGWTHSTINGSSGCDGCELWNDLTRTCYAGQVHQNRLALSLPRLYARDFGEVRMIPGRFEQAAKWGLPTPAENADKPWFVGKPRHIFVGDMGDFLSDAVTDDFLERELLAAVTSKAGQRHVWQWLTKRPARLAQLSEKWGGLPDNVVAMTTVTNQRTAAVRIPALLKVRCAVRGISAEPLLGPVDLMEWIYTKPLHWVIVGGESGAGCRPMQAEWARSLRDQCASAGADFFFKQWGGVRKEAHGRILDGKTHDEIPALADESNMVHEPHREDGRE
jgi:protein gp37